MAIYTRERVGIGVLETDVVYPMFSVNINKHLSLVGDALDVLSLLIGSRESVVIDGFECTPKNSDIEVSRGRCYVQDCVISVVESVRLTPIVGTYYVCLRYRDSNVSILLMTPSRYQSQRSFCVYLSTLMYDGQSITITKDPSLYHPMLYSRSEFNNIIRARSVQYIPAYRVVRVVGELVELADCRDVGYNNSVYCMSTISVSPHTEADFLLTGVVYNPMWNFTSDAPLVLGRNGLVVQSVEPTSFYVVYLGRVISSSTVYFAPTLSILKTLS